MKKERKTNPINKDNFEEIRKLAREFFIYGCSNKYDLEERKIIKQRSYEEYKEVFYAVISSENIEDERIERKQVIRLNYDYFKYEDNFFIELFKQKKFKQDHLFLYLFLQLYIKENPGSNLKEIVDEVSNETGAEKFTDDFSIRRRVSDLISWGLLDTSIENNMSKYYIPLDIFKNLTDDECISLYDAVCFYIGTMPITVSGYFLKETIEKYLKYQRKINIPQKIIYHRYKNIHAVLEENTIYEILEAIKNKKKIEIIYYEKNENNLEYLLIPIKLIFDTYLGRWYLLAKNEENQNFFYRIDKIRKVSLASSTSKVLIDKAIRESVNELEKNWSVSKNNSDILHSIKIKFHTRGIRKNDGLTFIQERVEREGRWGRITKIIDEYFIFEIDVKNVRDMAPWVRSFGDHAEIISCSDEHFIISIKNELGEMLRNYETFCTD